MHRIIEKYCSAEWISFLKFHSSEIHLGAKEQIFKIGDPTKGVYLLIDGKVKVLTAGVEQNRIIRLASNGDIIGHRGFGGNWTYPILAETLTPCKLIFMPIEVFNQVVKSNPELGFFMMMFFAEELRESERFTIPQPVKCKIAYVIYKNFLAFGGENEHGGKLNYTLSRTEIANYAGTTYESVIRALAELNKEKIIKLEGKSISILNLNGLRTLFETR